ncbi:MAG: glycosyltransferase family 4 protein [Anaerolineae bacterium]
MRIGIDARLLHYQKAGISRYTRHLLEGLAQLSIDEEMLILRSRKDPPSALPATPFRSVPMWTPPHNRFEQIALRLETSRLGLDLLHSPDFIPPFRRRFRSVVTVHDLGFLLYPHLLTRESAHYYGQIDQAVRSANHIIAVSESTKRDVTHLLGAPEDKVTVIHEAINPSFRYISDRQAVAATRARYGLPESFVLFVGTIEPRKNLPTLFRAMRRLVDQHKPDIALAVVGEWGWLYAEALQVLEQLRLKEVVHFLGHVPDGDLVYLYNAASVMAYPSYYEGFGLPPLEAMACGVPVVASDRSSVPEVIGDAGLLVTPDDDEAVAVALWHVLSDNDLRQTLVHRGFQRVRNFSIERMAQRTLALYRTVLGD